MTQEDSRVTYSDLEGDALKEKLRHDIVRTERSAWLKVFFLQNMSHELRSPLTAICGFSNLIAELHSTSDDVAMRKLAERISGSSTELLQQINHLLNSTREECLVRQQQEAAGTLPDVCPPEDTPIEELFALLNKARQHETSRTQLIETMSQKVHKHIDSIVDFAHRLAADSASTPELDVTEFVGLIEENSRLLLTLVDDIRDWGLMQSGIYRTRYTTVNPRHICEVCLESIRMRKPEGVELKLDYRMPPEQTIETDNVRLQQILRNLLINATKYTTQGSITLGCHLVNEGLGVEFSVADTGTGIAPENAELIFHRFEKLNSFKKGSGLGLHICRLIAARLGGEIHLDTTYQGGSRFVFTHPVNSAANDHNHYHK